MVRVLRTYGPKLPEGVDRRDFNFLLTLMNHCYWIIGGFLGALLSSALPFNSTGLEFSMTALFVSVLVEQWEKSKNHIAAIIGASVSLVCLVIFGADKFLIPAMIGISVCLFAFRKQIEGDEKND